MNRELRKEEVIQYIETWPSYTFHNEHGEKFTIHSNGIMAFMSGDEVNAMVPPTKKIGGYIPLFNPDFSIWSKDELRMVGEALIQLNGGKTNG